jgi:hypothetical protein
MRERIQDMVYLLDMEDMLEYRDKTEIVSDLMRIWRTSYQTRQDYIISQLKSVPFNWSVSDLQAMKIALGDIHVSKTKKDNMEVNEESCKLDRVKARSGIFNTSENEKIESDIDLTAYGEELIPSVVRFAAILTYEESACVSVQDTLRFIASCPTLCGVFIDQCNIWWGLSEKDTFIDLLIQLFDKTTDQTYLNDILYTIKEAMSHDFNLKDKKALLTNLNSLLKPKEVEKKKYGEVFTPLNLVEEMLDKLPSHVWSDPSLTWFDPAVGIGNFMVCIYYRLMEGLKDAIACEEERSQHIISNMLYMSELNAKNVLICRRIFGKDANIHEGDTLTFEPLHEEFGLAKFDIVVGNPPYNDASGNKGKGHTLWTRFVELAIQKWCNEGGYICMVHPALWRQYGHNMFTLMTSKQILYLEIHNEKDGLKTFRCNTRYDWYVLENKPVYDSTMVKDQDGIENMIHMCEWKFLPNSLFDTIRSLLSTADEDRCEIIRDRSNYGSDKSHVSKHRSNVNKYPVVYSINRQDVPTLLWSSCNTKGHFGIAKVIYGGGATGFISDHGVYGLTEWSKGIVAPVEEHEHMIHVLKTDIFRKIILALSVSKAEINTNIIRLFRAQWWTDSLFVQ